MTPKCLECVGADFEFTALIDDMQPLPDEFPLRADFAGSFRVLVNIDPTLRTTAPHP